MRRREFLGSLAGLALAIGFPEIKRPLYFKGKRIGYYVTRKQAAPITSNVLLTHRFDSQNPLANVYNDAVVRTERFRGRIGDEDILRAFQRAASRVGIPSRLNR